MRRTLFAPEHEEFRHLVRKVIEREVSPYHQQWCEAGIVPRDLFRTLGAVGVMGFSVPEEYGGAGTVDYRYNVVIQEETARAVVTLGGLRTHLDIVLPYLLAFADEGQRGRWFPGLASGDLYTAIAMSEPGVGSDLAGISTVAVRAVDVASEQVE
ncbi:acyl-CoA dehydrogenase family protein [Micromonospora sp. NPDC003241]